MWHAVRIEDGRILFSHEDKSTVTAWIDRHHCWFFVQVELGHDQGEKIPAPRQPSRPPAT